MSEECQAEERRPVGAAWRLLAPLGLMGVIVFGWFGPMPSGLPSGSDKWIHFVFYGSLAASWLFALAPWNRPPRSVAAAAFVLSVTWGILDELLQVFAEGRTASSLDALADVAGAGLVACIGALVLGRLRARDRRTAGEK